jgi:hypothetical protein
VLTGERAGHRGDGGAGVDAVTVVVRPRHLHPLIDLGERLSGARRAGQDAGGPARERGLDRGVGGDQRGAEVAERRQVLGEGGRDRSPDGVDRRVDWHGRHAVSLPDHPLRAGGARVAAPGGGCPLSELAVLV